MLLGDVNGDRVVNDLDSYTVWQNQLKPVASRDLNADLNGDGQVDAADVAVVRSHFVAKLPAHLSSEQKVERYLTALVGEDVAARTQNQAFDAIIILYGRTLTLPRNAVRP